MKQNLPTLMCLNSNFENKIQSYDFTRFIERECFNFKFQEMISFV